MSKSTTTPLPAATRFFLTNDAIGQKYIFTLLADDRVQIERWARGQLVHRSAVPTFAARTTWRAAKILGFVRW